MDSPTSTAPGPFEGPEKLLEVWFAPSPSAIPDKQASSGSGSNLGIRTRRNFAGEPGQRQNYGNGIEEQGQMGEGEDYTGLRKVPREVWEEMLDIVKCKVLSVVEGDEIDAYLLSESSLFVAPHLLILKTCGTTLNLLGLYRIIEIARAYCGFTNVWRCFYSRKSFFFPERQQGPHKDWGAEVRFLDSVFGSAGSAYTVGPMNRDHWLLYLTSPNSQPILPSDTAPPPPPTRTLSIPQSPSSSTILSPPSLSSSTYHDTTLEILMSHLSHSARAPFFSSTTGHEAGRAISSQLGIDKLFPASETALDSFAFEPCGYSANAVIGSGLPGKDGGGYFTIHVTPEDGWSYASFECNISLPTSTSTATPALSTATASSSSTPLPASNTGISYRPTLQALIKSVIQIFQPSRLSITLFDSTPSSSPNIPITQEDQRAWQVFGTDLFGGEFERKDRIGYEFDGYDLVFACFEKRGWVEKKVGAVRAGELGLGQGRDWEGEGAGAVGGDLRRLLINGDDEGR